MDREQNRLTDNFHGNLAGESGKLFVALQAVWSQYPDKTTSKDLESLTDLGVKMRPAYLNWLRGFGLATSAPKGGGVVPTEFGKLVAESKLLEGSDVQWLMHYFMAAPSGPGPQFWHDAVCHFSALRAPFTKTDWTDYFNSRPVVADSVEKQWPRFRDAYVSEMLSNLRLIRVMGNSGSDLEFDPPIRRCGANVFACVLIDHWMVHWSDLVSVEIERLFEDGGIADVMLLTRDDVDEYLGELASHGLVDVFRIAPPYQITRRWTDHEEQFNEQLKVMFDAQS